MNIYHRNILDQITKFLNKDITLLIIGSRQTGKTVLLSLIRQQILEQKIVSENQIVNFDLEKGNDLSIFTNNTPDKFVEYLFTRSALTKNSQIYVFIDEIQYLPNASSYIKILIDHYPQIRLILSGSSSLEIKQIFSDRLTGRKISFILPTLTFQEYLIFQEYFLAKSWQKINLEDLLAGKIQNLKSYNSLISEILPIFEEFIIFGGYPKPSLKENKSIRYELLVEIRDAYARRDVADILKIENVAGFNRLLGLLAVQIGNLVNFDELASSANLNRLTVEKYIFLLEETFILKMVKPYFTNPRQEIIKMPKVYFMDTGLRNLLIEQSNQTSLDLRPDKGALVENVIFHEIQALGWPIKFWRTKTKAEVDFIISSPNGQIIPLEVKYQPLNKPDVPTGLISFIKTHKPKMAFVVTKNYFEQIKYQSTTIYFIPAALF